MSRATISSAVMITYQAWAKPLSRPSSPANRKTMNDQPAEKQSWWQRLSGGLKRTSASIGGAVADLVAKRKLDEAMLEEIEDVLIRADLGIESAARSPLRWAKGATTSRSPPMRLNRLSRLKWKRCSPRWPSRSGSARQSLSLCSSLASTAPA